MAYDWSQQPVCAHFCARLVLAVVVPGCGCVLSTLLPWPCSVLPARASSRNSLVRAAGIVRLLQRCANCSADCGVAGSDPAFLFGSGPALLFDTPLTPHKADLRL